MTYQQVRDVVSHLRTVHQQLRDVLEQPRSRTVDSRTRSMLEMLQRDEQELQNILARSAAQNDGPLLDTWLQYVPDEEVRDALATIEFTPDMPADEVVARKLEFDQAMMTLLRQLSEETAVPRVQQFFHDLLKYAESCAARQAWSVREYLGDVERPHPDG